MRKGEPFLLWGVYSMYRRAGQPLSSGTSRVGAQPHSPHLPAACLGAHHPPTLVLHLHTSAAANSQQAPHKRRLTPGTTEGFTKPPRLSHWDRRGWRPRISTSAGLVSVMENRTSGYLLNCLSPALSHIKISKMPVCAAVREGSILLKRSLSFLDLTSLLVATEAGGTRCWEQGSKLPAKGATERAKSCCSEPCWGSEPGHLMEKQLG